MFRRFMVVCWVILAVAVVASATGWGIYKYSNTKILSIRDSGGIVHDEVNADWNQPLVIEHRLRAMQLVNERRIRILKELEEYDDIPAGFELVDIEVGLTKSQLAADLDAINAQLKDVRRHRRVHNTASAVSIAAGLIALVIFLWNIFCHTAHWIWMGRKTG